MKRFVLYIHLTLGLFQYAAAQAVFIDRPIQSDEILLFPDISDTNRYYYLPNKIFLGKQEDGKPQFSFLRYVENVKTKVGEEAKREGEGGGIIHSLVGIGIPEDQLNAAKNELKRKTKNEKAEITGPIIFRSGTIGIVSSMADEKGGFTKQLIGLGKAPLLSGNKAAISVQLTKLGSKVLWESFKTSTPDLSFSFVMEMAGYRSPMKAEIIANFDQIYEHHGFKAGLEGRYLDATIKATFDDLRKSGAIQVNNIGSDAKLEELVNAGYQKLIDMMFEPMQMPQENAQAQNDPMGNLINMLGLASGAATGGVGTAATIAASTKLSVGYQFKRQKVSGSFTINLNKAISDVLTIRFDENIGSQLDCATCFRQVNLDDPFYRQREVLVSVDGLNANQFSKYVNFVTVSMKKNHGNGDITTDELRITQKEFENTGNLFRLLYGWKDDKDNDREKWLKYDVKTSWSFFGDHSVIQDWHASDQMGINLAPPFHPVSVSVEADPDLVKKNNIRVMLVKFFYDYGAGEKMEQVTLKANDKNLAQLAEFMLKQGSYEYEYEVIWRLTGNKTISSGRKKASETLLYVDELPE